MAREHILKKLPLKRLGIIGAGAALVYIALVGYSYVVSPAAIRRPAFQHYHLRLQVLVNGKAENFGSKEYQVSTPKDVCNVSLTKEPLHFHDSKDQMLHVHWDSITGGEILKYYGWNYIGGLDDALGYRFDSFPTRTKVPIHGHSLPSVPEDAEFYIFIGDEHGFKERPFSSFLHQDLERFLGKKSNIPEASRTDTSLWNVLFPKAYAHDGEDEAELKRINNLVGNVVIFVQKDRPTADQVKSRFERLEPLAKSTCSG